MVEFKPVYKPFGERAILVEWPEGIDVVILKDITSFIQKIENNNIESLVEMKHGYNSLLIIYDVFIKDFAKEIQCIDKIYRSKEIIINTETVSWKIPVCYDANFGVDLDLISKEKKLTKEQIIRLHSESVYTVYFIGFLPGFLYLGGLSEKLWLPRKSTPRLQVEKGAVAIGGGQTGVYPNESPGGWNIIGNSPIDFFDVNKKIPCFAKAGDTIVFYPISLQEYKKIKILVDAKVFQLESEVVND
ncbi:allophanate hydrolase [Pseudalgibacter alginicilyticus]|uniref:Allophanate hydrolase n=1 Tax=Pseudalgibacter alginicilyticus TaxID=1736674 RepID=A0A0P0CQH8_9FLAO|nr:5-oxoprolinase subunit PxpB [Pseudalgibacter alginicilyticus]ALJ06720.1 allophanate hydrolase [Pseudalgibacter alginicilyticus]